MTPEYRIISIGTLAAHPLWNEKTAVRTGHATTTLISAGDTHILVNPGLPAQALAARMSEHTPVQPAQVTQVFLTSFAPDHRRGLGVFDQAQWLISEAEREAASASLKSLLDQALESGDAEVIAIRRRELELLDRLQDAPDSLASSVDLFPLPGVTAGTCGLLIALPGSTVLVCGDAVATSEHLAQGKVLPHCANLQQAQESFKEAIEIADVLILGRDNLGFNPLRRL